MAGTTEKLCDDSKMLAALRSGDVEKVTSLLDSGMDVNHSFELGGALVSALCLAVQGNHPHLVHLLCSRRARLSSPERTGHNPLHLAVSLGYWDIVNILLLHGVDTEWRTVRNNDTALHIAAMFGFSHVVYALLNYGADPNATNDQGRTPLMLAAGEAPELDLIDMLIEFGAVVNCTDSEGNTAFLMHTGSDMLSADVCNRLVEGHTGIIDRGNVRSEYPIMRVLNSTADDHERTRVLKMLLGLNVNLNISDKKGNTPLHVACAINDFFFAEEFLRHGARPDIEDHLGQTGLFCLMKANQFRLVDMALAACKPPALSTHQLEELDDLGNAFWYIQNRLSVDSLKYLARRALRIKWGMEALQKIPRVQIPHTLRTYLYNLDLDD